MSRKKVTQTPAMLCAKPSGGHFVRFVTLPLVGFTSVIGICYFLSESRRKSAVDTAHLREPLSLDSFFECDESELNSTQSGSNSQPISTAIGFDKLEAAATHNSAVFKAADSKSNLSQSIELTQICDSANLQPIGTVEVARRCFQLFRIFWRVLCTLPLVGIEYALFGSGNHHDFGSSALSDWWLRELAERLNEAGCVWIKLAQWISMRPDIFGHKVCSALLPLTHRVRAHSAEESAQIVMDAFGVDDIHDVFQHFDSCAHSSSGAIAQIHFATLQSAVCQRLDVGFHKVAVKIRHPSVSKKHVATDLRLLFAFSDSLSAVLSPFGLGSFSVIPISQHSFCLHLLSQIDLRNEAFAMAKFRRNFQSVADVDFPAIVPALCSEAVLVESWEGGDLNNDSDSVFNDEANGRAKISTVQNTKRKTNRSEKDNVRLLTTALAEYRETHGKTDACGIPQLAWVNECGLHLLMKMLWSDGVVHTDLHSANIMIDTESHKLIVLDAGLSVEFDVAMRRRFGSLFLDILVGDANSATNLLLSFDRRFAALSQPLDDCCEPRLQRVACDLQRDICALFDRFGVYVQRRAEASDEQSPFSYEIGGVMNALISALQRNSVRIDSDFAAMMLSIGIVEGIAKQIEPHTDVISRSIAYFDHYNGTHLMRHKIHAMGGDDYLLQLFGIIS